MTDGHNPARAVACAHCPFLSSSVFGGIPKSELVELNQHRVANIYQPGQVIFYESNLPVGIHCMESGRVKLYKASEGGRRRTVRIGVAGDLLGYRALLAGEPYRATAEALDKSRICFIEKGAFFSILHRYPEVAIRLTQRVCADLGRAEESLHDAVHKPVEARLAKLLLYLKDTCGSPAPQGIRIRPGLSRGDLAEWIGTSSETVIRFLSRFRKQGFIRTQDRDITLCDLRALTSIANS